MEFSVIPGRFQMELFILVENFRKKGNTFRSIISFPIQPGLPKISVPFVKKLLPGSLGNIPWRNERWRIRVMNLYRCRPFMPVTDVSFLRHCYRYSCNTAVALLFIRASNSAGKHMAGFCYFTDESGRTKPYSHKSALCETEPVTVIFYAALSLWRAICSKITFRHITTHYDILRHMHMSKRHETGRNRSK